MDARNNELPVKSEYTYATGEAPSIGVAAVLGTLRRKWRYPAVGGTIGLALAVCYLALTPTLYKSSARILLDLSVDRYLKSNKIVDEPIFDDTQIGSQIYILSSESVILPVVRSMNLTHDSEFVGSPKVDRSRIVDRISNMINALKQFIGWDDNAHATVDPEAIAEQRAVESFFERLSVYREDVPNVINVTFSSEDPNKAAKIANAISDSYISNVLEAKLKSTKLVSQWLQDRMMELKTQASEADRALQDYKIAHNLVDTGKGLLSSEQLSDLNAKLANARIAVAEAKSRVDGINTEGKRGATATDALTNGAKAGVTLNNSDIVKLRSEYRDVAAKATELEGSLGRGHAAVIKLHKKMDDLRASIRDQEQLIADSYANEYQMAKARESELAAAVAQLVGEAGTSSQAQVTVRELESSSDALRALYNTFLQKYKEINTVQNESIPVESARIITRAAPPLHKSSKKGAAVVVGSTMLGLLLGAGAAVSREWAAGVFRTPKEVEHATGIRCDVLPMVTAGRGRTASLVEEFVLEAPYARFTESLRNVKALIDDAQLAHGVKVIGVVSSVPKEGKTTVASNLAALMVASSGARTLLIDSDVHLRLLSARLAPDARVGLIEALLDPSRLDVLVSKRQRSGVDFLPCVLPTCLPNAAELLGSPRMGDLLAAARRAYDYIVIEIAPIMSVVDIKKIERYIDRFVLVVEWGQTKRSVVLEALSETQNIRERVLGIALNKADPVALLSMEAYKGNKFRDYYQD